MKCFGCNTGDYADYSSRACKAHLCHCSSHKLKRKTQLHTKAISKHFSNAAEGMSSSFLNVNESRLATDAIPNFMIDRLVGRNDPITCMPCPLESHITISEMVSKQNTFDFPKRDTFIFDLNDDISWNCSDDVSECLSQTLSDDETLSLSDDEDVEINVTRDGEFCWDTT